MQRGDDRSSEKIICTTNRKMACLVMCGFFNEVNELVTNCQPLVPYKYRRNYPAK